MQCNVMQYNVMYVFMYVCMYVCMYVMYVCMYVCMYVYMYVCMYVTKVSNAPMLTEVFVYSRGCLECWGVRTGEEGQLPQHRCLKWHRAIGY